MNLFQTRTSFVQEILNANSVNAYLQVISQTFLIYNDVINWFIDCDCDPNAADPDSFCPFNQFCKQCKCLQKGCDCDENLPNADDFCPRDQVSIEEEGN